MFDTARIAHENTYDMRAKNTKAGIFARRTAVLATIGLGVVFDHGIGYRNARFAVVVPAYALWSVSDKRTRRKEHQRRGQICRTFA